MLDTCGLAVEIVEQQNGKEALDYLNAHTNEEDKLPDMIFLDLNMPVMNGLEFLAELNRMKAAFKRTLPICVISSSADYRDMAAIEKYKNIVSSYLVKPVSRVQYRKVLDVITTQD